jgi:hypothetical protein
MKDFIHIAKSLAGLFLLCLIVSVGVGVATDDQMLAAYSIGIIMVWGSAGIIRSLWLRSQ